MKWYHYVTSYLTSLWWSILYHYRVMKIKNTHGYRVVDKILKMRRNILNGYYANRSIRFPYKDIQQMVNHLQSEHLELISDNYDYYEYYNNNMSVYRNIVDIFSLPTDVSSSAFKKHEEDFKVFLKTYQKAYLEIMLFNIYNGREHIATNSIYCLFDFLYEFRVNIRKEQETILKLKLKEALS